MRKLFAWVVIFGLAACGGDGGARGVASSDPFCQEVIPRVDAFMAEAREANPTPDDERYGGTVVVAGIGEIPDGMNAAVSANYAARQHQEFVNLMPLVNYSAELEVQPYLAESWEVSADGTELTFHIPQDGHWHDGEQPDAHGCAVAGRLGPNPWAALP